MNTRGGTRYWVIVPAAGAGRRMHAALPKQYLHLDGRAVLAHTLDRLCSYPRIDGVVLGLAAGDSHWPQLRFHHPRLLQAYIGGIERAFTVLNGLLALSAHAQPEDWVLVHDAVRPCVRHADLDALIQALHTHRDGALLGAPVSDTIKRTDANSVIDATVERQGLWRAFTPQAFRYARLKQALERALADSVIVTDESAAVERLGDRPRLVSGHGDNIKITAPADLALAEWYLKKQGE